MSGKFVGASANLRKSFTFAHKDVTHFFPGHMAKGLLQMQRRLKDLDAIIEVHDARTVNLRPHLLVLNKVDLADLTQKAAVESCLKKRGIKNILYTNCKEQTNTVVKKQILPAVLEMVGSAERYHRSDAEDYNLMIIGVPNVGKSSLINALRRMHLRKGKATRVGGEAGITRSVLEKIKISQSPTVYVYDSPGILHPDITDMNEGMKLALCATLKDHLVGEDTIADYMLYWLNKHEHFRYVEQYNLPEPTDNIYQLLTRVAKEHKAVLRQRSVEGGYKYRPNFIRAAQIVIRDFRNGVLGKVNLDQDILSETELKSADIR